MTPPKPKLSIITQTGDVIVQFDKRMRILPDLDMTKAVIEKLDGTLEPVLDI